MASLGDMIVRIVGDITDFNKSIDAAHSKFQAATSNFQKLGANLTKFVTLPILGIGAAAVKSAADMEMQEAAFTTLLGSAERARNMLDDLATLAAKTPFEMPDLAEASRTMLSFGIEAEKILPNLRMLGDISGGNADKLRSLTLAFSQIQSTGRLMGQDLLQLINAGFNPLTIIAQKTGKSMAQLKKEMEQGAISAEQVSEAFKIATSEGGLFFGGMERASKTLTGQISTLMDDLKALGRSIGAVLLPAIKDIVADISEWVKNFTALDDNTKRMIITVAGIVAAIGPLLSVVLKLTSAIPALSAAMTFLSANPIILGLAAVAAAAVAISVGMKKAAADTNTLKVALEGVASIEQYRAAVKLQEAAVAKAERELASFGTGYAKAGLDKALADEKAKLALIRENFKYASLTIAAKEAAAAEDAKAAEAELKRLEAATKAGSAIVVSAEKEVRATEEQIEVTADLDAQRREAYETYMRAREQMAELAAEEAAAEEEAARRVGQAWANAYTTMNQVSKPVFEEIGSMIADGEFEWKNLGTVAINAIGGIVSALGDELAAKAAAKLVEAAAALASILTAPLAPGLFTSAGILAAGAAGAWTAGAALKSTKLAEGGIVMPQPGGVQALVAEAGQAEAVIPLDRFDQMLSRVSNTSTDGGMQHIVVNLDSRPLLDKIFDATRNRTVLISAGAVV